MTRQQNADNNPLVLCLHASASSKRQWTAFLSMVQDRAACLAADLVGYGEGNRFVSERRFCFDQEIENIFEQIQKHTGDRAVPLHLVGHSYGGATALQLALKHPERVSSITIYEPAQFLMLFDKGLRSAEAREILAVWKYGKDRVSSTVGRFLAAKRFIEYWSGEGTWHRLPLKRRCQFARIMPKVVAEFEAILSSGVDAEAFARLDVPVRLICGSNTRATTRRVAEKLRQSLPNVEFLEVEGAAHMAPTTEPERINPLFAEHVFSQLGTDLPAAA